VSVPRLNEAQRRAVGHRAATMADALAEVHRAGLEPPTLDALERALRLTVEQTEAILPHPPAHRLRGLLAQATVQAYELGPRSLGGYGSVDLATEAFLAERSEELQALLHQLLRKVEAASAMG